MARGQKPLRDDTLKFVSCLASVGDHNQFEKTSLAGRTKGCHIAIQSGLERLLFPPFVVHGCKRLHAVEERRRGGRTSAARTKASRHCRTSRSVVMLRGIAENSLKSPRLRNSRSIVWPGYHSKMEGDRSARPPIAYWQACRQRTKKGCSPTRCAYLNAPLCSLMR